MSHPIESHPSRPLQIAMSPTSLPREITPFVSREDELRALEDLFASHRLVTITGPYGVGKSRLAIRHGWREHARHVDGPVFYCELSHGTTTEDLCTSLLASHSEPVPAANGPSCVERSGDLLAARGAHLVILDNFEHLVSTAAPAIQRWLARAPETRFLVTSRERLRLAGEVCLQLDPLAPDDAIELLSHRARALVPDFAVDAHNHHAVLDICHQLDGLPLALEMTAPWLQVLSASELAQRLQAGLALCHDGATGNRRHASLEAAIGWSWDLLSPAERDFMTQAAVFRGHFTLDDVVAVVAIADGSPVLTLLKRLRERSLLNTVRNPIAHRVDFALNPCVRAFALARRPPGASTTAIEARHRARIESLAARLLDELDGPDDVLALAELARLRPDLLFLRSQDAAPSGVLARALEAARGRGPKVSCRTDPAVTAAPVATDLPGLTIHRRGDWFRAAGRTVDLTRRGPMRQILLGLVAHAAADRSEPLSLDEVYQLGWPGERIAPESVSNRVYAALSTLRRLGLGNMIATRRGGWLLDPSIPIDKED